MSITKILSNDKLSAEEKLEQVAEIVAGAREKYGNQEADIPDTKVETVNGHMYFAHLEDDSKVQILRDEAGRLKAKAITYVENHPGSMINKKIEELLATNSYFANVAAGTKFDYL